jgi:hypothetical protein
MSDVERRKNEHPLLEIFSMGKTLNALLAVPCARQLASWPSPLGIDVRFVVLTFACEACSRLCVWQISGDAN